MGRAARRSSASSSGTTTSMSPRDTSSRSDAERHAAHSAAPRSPEADRVLVLQLRNRLARAARSDPSASEGHPDFDPSLRRLLDPSRPPPTQPRARPVVSRQYTMRNAPLVLCAAPKVEPVSGPDLLMHGAHKCSHVERRKTAAVTFHTPSRSIGTASPLDAGCTSSCTRRSSITVVVGSVNMARALRISSA